MGRKSYAAVPNRLIEDCSLKHTTKRVAVALLMESSRRNKGICISYEDLAKRSGCGIGTAQKAVQELIAHGYVTQERNYRYCEALGRAIIAKNTYRIVQLPGGYTLVPRSALRRRGKRGGAHASFSVLLYLYRCAGRVGRAYPSLRRMADELHGCGASKASICRALAMLEKELSLIRRECRRMRQDLSCNSYYLTDMVIAGKCFKETHTDAEATNANTVLAGVNPGSSYVNGISPKELFFQLWGGLKLSKLPWINKITRVYILRKREKGVFEFVRSYKLLGKSRITKIPWGMGSSVSSEHQRTTPTVLSPPITGELRRKKRENARRVRHSKA